jgi:hypothetical protein
MSGLHRPPSLGLEWLESLGAHQHQFEAKASVPGSIRELNVITIHVVEGALDNLDYTLLLATDPACPRQCDLIANLEAARRFMFCRNSHLKRTPSDFQVRQQTVQGSFPFSRLQFQQFSDEYRRHRGQKVRRSGKDFLSVRCDKQHSNEFCNAARLLKRLEAPLIMFVFYLLTTAWPQSLQVV